jgi:hypothetical protein
MRLLPFIRRLAAPLLSGSAVVLTARAVGLGLAGGMLAAGILGRVTALLPDRKSLV